MEGMKYGYASVSRGDQNPALQLAALKNAGRKTVFIAALLNVDRTTLCRALAG